MPPTSDSVLLYRFSGGNATEIVVKDVTQLENQLKQLWQGDQINLPSYWLFQKRDSRWFQWLDPLDQNHHLSSWTEALPHQVPKTVRVLHMLLV